MTDGRPQRGDVRSVSRLLRLLLKPAVCGTALFVLLFTFPDSLAACAGRQSLPPQEQTEPFDHWFVIEIAGQTVGYAHEVLDRADHPPETGVKVRSDMKMVLNRLGVEIEISFAAESFEAPDGTLRRIRYEMAASELTTLSEAVVDPARGIIELRKQAGSEPSSKPYSSRLEFSGTLLGPEGGRRLSVSRLKNAGDSVSFQTFSPELEKVVSITRTVLARDDLKLGVLGPDSVSVLKVEEIMSGLAVKQTLWVDALTHHLLKQEEPGPFGRTSIIRSDKSAGLAAVSGVSLPEEIYARSIIRSNIRLPRPRSVERLKIKITFREVSLGLPELGSEHQTVREKTDKSIVLETRRPEAIRLPKESFQVPPSLDRPGKLAFPAERSEFLEPNAYIQSDDPEILRLCSDVIGGERDIFLAAKKLERWTAENMTFDLGIVFAPSSEIMRNRRGTCVGYATLLATLCRAAGIPSRVLLGLVYSNGIFGGHAWTEILAAGTWLPLDAAIPSDGPADAARLSLGSSSLKDGAGSLSSGAGLQVFGNVLIEIMEYKVADRKAVSVPAGAQPYRIQGNLYENRWLGIALQKPENCAFLGLDSIWPDLTVVAIEGPGGQRAVLKQLSVMPWLDRDAAARRALEASGFADGLKEESAGLEASPMIRGINKKRLPAFRMNRPSAASLVVLDEEEAWVLTTHGRDAAGLLETISRSLAVGLR